MCLRPLHKRIHEHGQPSRGGEVFKHKTHCPKFKKSLAKLKKENSYQYLKPAQKDRLISYRTFTITFQNINS
jgi:hypothetical protein